MQQRVQSNASIQLDWGVLYAPPETFANMKQSKVDIGSCAMTARGTCQVVDYFRDSDSYRVIYFPKNGSNTDSNDVKTENIDGSELMYGLPVCVGLTINSGYGLGTVIAYRENDSIFEIAYSFGVGYSHVSNLRHAYPVARVYATAAYILDNYVLQKNDADGSKITAQDSGDGDSATSVVGQSQQSSTMIIKGQIASFHKLLMDCNDRVTQLAKTAADAATAPGDNANADANHRGSDLAKLSKMFKAVSADLHKITDEHAQDQKEDAETDATVASASTAGSNVALEAITDPEIKQDVALLMNYFDKFSSLMTSEYSRVIALAKEVASTDPILSEMVGRLTKSYDTVMGKLETLQNTKSYRAYASAKEHFSHRLEEMMGASELSSVRDALRKQMSNFMASAGSQLLVSQGTSLLQRCKESPHANRLIEQLFHGAGDKVTASESDLRQKVNKLDLLLSSAESAIDGNSSSIVSVMVLNMLELDTSTTSHVGTISDLFSASNGALKHALCLKLCGVLLMFADEAEKRNGGRKLSGSEILHNFRDTPMQSMLAIFNIYSNTIRKEKLNSLEEGSMVKRMLEAGSTVMAEHPEVTEQLRRMSMAAMSMARNGSIPTSLMNADNAMNSVRAALDSDMAEEALSTLVTTGDRFLSAVETMRENEYVQQALSHISEDYDTSAMLNAAMTKASTLDVNSVFDQMNILVTDKDARRQLVDLWKDQILDFLIGFLPTLQIPDIDGIKDDLQYHVSGLDMSGIKLRKEAVSINLVDEPFTSLGLSMSGSSRVEELSATTTAGGAMGEIRQRPLDLFSIHVGGISAVFTDVEWSYLQLFFPHLHGDGLASAEVSNASLDLSFKLVRVPKGVIATLASDPDGPYKASKKVFETFSANTCTVKAQLEQTVRVKAGGVSASSTDMTAPENQDLSDEYCDWGAVTEWEPALVMTGGGKDKIFSIEKLSLITDQENALLAWLYNAFANLFERTIKDYVCVSLMEMLESNAAELLSYINASLATYFPMIKQVLKVSVENIPMATVDDLYRLVGPDPCIDGYSAGPKRTYTIKFEEQGPLGVKLDIVSVTGGTSVKTSGSQKEDEKEKPTIKAVITGAKEGSQAERSFRNVAGLAPSQLSNSTLVSVNGTKVAGMSEDEILAMFKTSKRPLNLSVSVSDEVYSLLRSLHAEEVTLRRREEQAQLQSGKSSEKLNKTEQQARTSVQASKEAAAPTRRKSKAGQYRKLKVVKVSFGEGSLGLKLKETKSCGGAVIITGFARDKETDAKLQAELLGVLEPGMLMLAIGDEVVFGKPFDVVMGVIQKSARPMNMLFVRSPDLQVVMPSHITSIDPQQLMIGMIEGYVMITANNMKTLLAVGDDKENCDKLVPGMIILQANKQPVLADASSPESLNAVYTLMSSANPIKLAIRDMDSFMHLLRIRDQQESLENDVTYE